MAGAPKASGSRPPSHSPTSHLFSLGFPPSLYPLRHSDLFSAFLSGVSPLFLHLLHAHCVLLPAERPSPACLRPPSPYPRHSLTHLPTPVSTQLGIAGSAKRKTAAARSCTRQSWARRSAAAPAAWAPRGPRRTSTTTRSSSGWFSTGAPPTASPAKVGLFLPSLQALSRGRLTAASPLPSFVRGYPPAFPPDLVSREGWILPVGKTRSAEVPRLRSPMQQWSQPPHHSFWERFGFGVKPTVVPSPPLDPILDFRRGPGPLGCELRLHSCDCARPPGRGAGWPAYRRALVLTRPSFHTVETCENVDCGPGKKCRMNKKNKPRCVCAPDCSNITWKGPVCGLDGKTYRNECALLKARCKEQPELEVQYQGKCKSRSHPSPSSNTEVDPRKTEAMGCRAGEGGWSQKPGSPSQINVSDQWPTLGDV